MGSIYKKLGVYIRLVDERNHDLAITNLQGVSITKEFVPSIANIIGTDLSTYKIVRTGQFAYGPVTSRNGDKVSIALLKGEDCIISSSYVPFEVYKPDELLPEYLMLWFMRPEFDRYARFMSNGSAREVFDWDSMCGVELPVPSLLEQRKIVHDYQVITDRIELLRKMNEKLENLGETVYKGAFEAYKEELPDDWHFHKLSEYLPVITGKKDVNTTCSNGRYPFFSCSQDCLWTNEFSFDTDAILVAGNGDFNVKYYSGKFEAYQRTYVLIPNNQKYVGWLYFVVKGNLPKAVTAARGSVISFITKGILEDISFPVPDDDNELLKFCDQAVDILRAIRKNTDEIYSLEELQGLILSNMRNAHENDCFEICG
jgi:type I restriction enzyme S subunit